MDSFLLALSNKALDGSLGLVVLFNNFLSPLSEMVVLTISFNDGDLVKVSLKVTNWLAHELEVSKLADWGLGGLFQDSLVLLLESLRCDAVGLGVLHPVDGEKISEARVDVSAVDNSV